MPEAASADACWSLMLVVWRYVDEDPEALLCAVIIWHLLRIFDEQHAVEDVTFQATNFADVIDFESGIFRFLWSHVVFGESLRSLYQSLCGV